MFTLQVHICGHRFYFSIKIVFIYKNNAIQILNYLGSLMLFLRQTLLKRDDKHWEIEPPSTLH